MRVASTALDGARTPRVGQTAKPLRPRCWRQACFPLDGSDWRCDVFADKGSPSPARQPFAAAAPLVPP